MWDAQEGVPGAGDYLLFPHTVYAIELNTTVAIPEWNKDIRIMLEEAGYWGEESFNYVNGRQTNFFLISSGEEEQGIQKELHLRQRRHTNNKEDHTSSFTGSFPASIIPIVCSYPASMISSILLKSNNEKCCICGGSMK